VLTEQYGYTRRGIILYIENQSVCPFVRIDSPPPPLPQASESAPPPPWNQRGGGQHSLAGEGRGEPIRTTGEKAWHSIYSMVIHNIICIYLATLRYRTFFVKQCFHQTQLNFEWRKLLLSVWLTFSSENLRKLLLLCRHLITALLYILYFFITAHITYYCIFTSESRW
jgi:hypothetical protein